MNDLFWRYSKERHVSHRDTSRTRLSRCKHVLHPVNATLLAATFALAGCETRPSAAQYTATLQPPPSEPAPAPAPPAPPPERPREARKLAKPAVRTVSRTDQPATRADQPLPNLIGLNEQQITDLLGTPAAQDGGAPGKHWYYHLRHCVVDLSLYPEVSTHTFHLLSYEVSDDDDHSDAKRHCQQELAERLQSRQARRN